MPGKILMLGLLLYASTYSTEETKCSKNKYEPHKLKPVKLYTVDLDVSPKNRWTAIVKEYKNGIKELFNSITEMVELIPFGRYLVELFNIEAPRLLSTFPLEYAEELEGIADATGLAIGEVIAYNIFYDLFSICTSIVAQTSTGEQIHGRNLDFGAFLGWDLKNHTWKVSEILRKIVINVDFIKNGSVLYRETTFAGYIGVLTAVKRNSFGISINTRFSINNGILGILEYYFLHKTDQAWATWQSRDIMEKNTSYAQAVSILSKQDMISPVYFILSGVGRNEGTVITRSRSKSLKPQVLNEDADVWYLLQTNYDWWDSPPFFDNRRTPGEHCMNESTPATISKSKVFDVLSTDPVLNQLTVYTTLINPQTGELESYIRRCATCSTW